jgi:hypothetical protein
MSRLPQIVALLLLLLAAPSVPWLFAAPSGLSVWFLNLIDVIGLVAAAVLAMRRVRYWPLGVIAICGYLTYVATPPFVRMSVEGGFVNFMGIILRHAATTEFPRSFYTVWNLIVLPIVPPLFVLLGLWAWWATRKQRTNAESNL